MLKEREKIVIFCDYYLPGFRAGGPITSLKNLSSLLIQYYDVYLITRNHDYGSAKPYVINGDKRWHDVEGVKVKYLDKRVRAMTIIKLCLGLNPRFIYFNSVFSYQYSIKPLVLLKLVKTKIPILICPRGELHHGALAFGRLKKIVFLKIVEFLHIYRNVRFHATSDFEINRIESIFGKGIWVKRAVNLSRHPDQSANNFESTKKKGIAKLVYVGRINPIKNLLGLIKSLSFVKDKVTLSIIGHVDDERYWADCRYEIKTLPENVNVDFLGPLSNSDALELIKKSDCLCLLSNSENFGQVLYEALSVGVPIITSYFTPWKKLESKMAGWNVEIEDVENIVRVLQKIIEKTDLEWLHHKNAALNLAIEHHEKAQSENAQLFLGL